MKPKKEVIFVYAPRADKAFVADLATQYNDSISNVVVQIIESFRTGKKLKLEMKKPKFVHAAEAWAQKNG